MRILTNRQYDAICDIVSDLQKENEDLKAKIAKKDEALTYVNDMLFERTEEVSRLRRQVERDFNRRFIIDFPSTIKIPDPSQDINKILGL